MNEVTAEERISRFILSRGHHSIVNNRVKYGAFLPPPNRELSVYRTGSLSEEKIWDIGNEFVGKARQKKVLSRGDLRADIIQFQRLKVISAPGPHKLHANITDWPDEKGAQKLLAIELANASKLETPPA